MNYLLKGNVSGYLSPRFREPIANARLRFYLTENQQQKKEIRPKHAFTMLSKEMINEKEHLLIAETETDEKGGFFVILGKSHDYDGGSLGIDLCLVKEQGKKAAEEKSDAYQFSIAVITPRWIKTREGAKANWHCRLSHRSWRDISAWLRGGWSVYGRVLTQGTNTPVSGVIVRAFDADQGVQYDALGMAVTDAQGKYCIKYSLKDFIDYPSLQDFYEDSPFRAGPDLFFSVETAGGALLLKEPVKRGHLPDRENVGHAFEANLKVAGIDKLYVAGNGCVTVVDVAANAVEDTIAVVGNPEEVAFTPDGSFAYVANSSSNDISVIDTATRSIVSTIPVGGNSFSLAMAPDGDFCYVSGEQNLWVIDTAARILSETIPLDESWGHAWDVVITPDEAKVYITQYPETIAIFDTSNHTVDYIHPTDEITDLAISFDGTRLYVTDQYGDVCIIDTATNTTIDSFFTEDDALYGIGVTPDGARAYIGGYTYISVADLATNTMITCLPYENCGDVEISYSGICAYVCSPDGLHIVDTANNAVISTVANIRGNITIMPK